MADRPSPTCIGCGKHPAELAEYVEAAADYGIKISPDEYVRLEEGTFNYETDHFACTPCYVKMGQPTSRRGWKAP